MQSFNFQLVLDCPLELVFSIYTDIDRWQNRNLFGEIRWVQGNPWEEGSRLRIETRFPVRSSVDQVVQQFSRNDSVAYLSHVWGITCETRVRFAMISAKQTKIYIEMNILGTPTRVLDFAIEPLIAKVTRGFFEDLRRDCESAARAQAIGKQGSE